MRKIFIAFLCLLFPLATTPKTHPGRTDGNGGHTDRSTGEYHYHHGYSAHQHYDMDGDGKADCPYDFKDNTYDRNDYGNSGRSDSTYITTPATSATEPPKPSTAPTIPNVITEEEETKLVPNWVYWCLGILSVSLLCMVLKIFSQKEDIEIMRNTHVCEINRLKEQHEKQLHAKKATETDIANAKADLAKVRTETNKAEIELRKLIKKTVREEEKKAQAALDRELYRRAPLDVIFAADGKPVYWKTDRNKPYGDYTVYVKRDSAVYHTDRFCASYLSQEAHIFDYIEKRRPCQKCAKNAFNFTKVPEWYAQPVKEILINKNYE